MTRGHRAGPICWLIAAGLIILGVWCLLAARPWGAIDMFVMAIIVARLGRWFSLAGTPESEA